MTVETFAAESPASKPRTRLQVEALRHGLTGQTYIFTTDNGIAYRRHCADIRKHYAPVGPIEESLVDHVSHGIWRLQRAHAIEEGIFAIDGAARDDSQVGPAYGWLEQEKAFALLNAYENRVRRALDRDKAELAFLQARRKNEVVPPPPPPLRQSVCSKQAFRLAQAHREALAAAHARAKLAADSSAPAAGNPALRL